MQQKHLTDLFIDYLNWRARYVGVRPRTVDTEPTARTDPRWEPASEAIKAFLETVKRGDDLTPYLSILPHTRGYTPAALAPGATSEDKWSDKDFLLNTMGYHHFHLDAAQGTGGHGNGSDELIFAHVTRDTFKVIAIFGHEVFETGSPERLRLFELHQEIALRGLPPGSVVVMGNIATSGHSIHVVRYAQLCARWVNELEPKLNDLEFVRGLYRPREEAPTKPKPEWEFLHLDLAILDKAKPGHLIVQKGWN